MKLLVEVIPNFPLLVRSILVIKVVDGRFDDLDIKGGLVGFRPPLLEQTPVVALQHVQGDEEVPHGGAGCLDLALVGIVHRLHLLGGPVRSVVLVTGFVHKVHLTDLPLAEVFVKVRAVHQRIHVLHQFPILVGVRLGHRGERVAQHLGRFPHHVFALALGVFLHEVVDSHAHSGMLFKDFLEFEHLVHGDADAFAAEQHVGQRVVDACHDGTLADDHVERAHLDGVLVHQAEHLGEVVDELVGVEVAVLVADAGHGEVDGAVDFSVLAVEPVVDASLEVDAQGFEGRMVLGKVVHFLFRPFADGGLEVALEGIDVVAYVHGGLLFRRFLAVGGVALHLQVLGVRHVRIVGHVVRHQFQSPVGFGLHLLLQSLEDDQVVVEGFLAVFRAFHHGAEQAHLFAGDERGDGVLALDEVGVLADDAELVFAEVVAELFDFVPHRRTACGRLRSGWGRCLNHSAGGGCMLHQLAVGVEPLLHVVQVSQLLLGSSGHILLEGVACAAQQRIVDDYVCHSAVVWFLRLRS